MKGRRGWAGSSLVVMVRHPEVRLDPSGTNLEQSPSFAGAKRGTLGCRNYPPSLLGHGYFTPCLVATILHCKRWARILRGCNGASVATILYLRVGTGTSGAPSVATILHLMCGHGYFGGVFPAPTIWVGTSHHLVSGLWPSHQNVARRNYPPPSGGHGYFGQ